MITPNEARKITADSQMPAGQKIRDAAQRGLNETEAKLSVADADLLRSLGYSVTPWIDDDEWCDISW